VFAVDVGLDPLAARKPVVNIDEEPMDAPNN